MKVGLCSLICSVCVFTTALAISRTAAQSIPVVLVPPSNAVLREEFSTLSVHALRELQDGRVLVTETGNSSRLIVADFKSGTVSPLGRRGSGPGEYTLGIGLYRLSGDSTLMVVAQERWLLLNGATIAQTVTLSDPWLSWISGVDTLGQVLVRAAGRPDDDSGTVALRLRRGGTLVTTIRTASSAEPGYPRPPELRANGGVRYLNDPWVGSESALLFPDGWIAVARQRPYRIDWRSPDGKWTSGAHCPCRQ